MVLTVKDGDALIQTTGVKRKICYNDQENRRERAPLLIDKKGRKKGDQDKELSAQTEDEGSQSLKGAVNEDGAGRGGRDLRNAKMFTSPDKGKCQKPPDPVQEMWGSGVMKIKMNKRRANSPKNSWQ